MKDQLAVEMNIHAIEAIIISKLPLPNDFNFPPPLLVGVAFESALELDPEEEEEEDEVEVEAGGESVEDSALESASLKIFASAESGGRLSKAVNNTDQQDIIIHLVC